MTAPASKGHILEEAGYVYGFERMVYFNPRTKKVFSLEFVEDNTESKIQECIRESSGGGEWQFYFNSQPSDAVKRELERVLS